jgi:hypothetical protein
MSGSRIPEGVKFLTLRRVSDTHPGAFERTKRALAADRGPIDSYFKRCHSSFDARDFIYDVKPEDLGIPPEMQRDAPSQLYD